VEFFRKLFGGRPAAPMDEAVSPRVAEYVAALRAREEACLRLVPSDDPRSRLGGVPDMVGRWPRYEGRALCCVAQLDLPQVRAADGPAWLPDRGRLLFFYELEHGSWGMYPKDAGSAVVIHEVGPLIAAAEPDDLPDYARFPAYPVAFTQAASFPTEERLAIDWKSLNAASTDALEQALVELAPAPPAHQIGGYASPVQNDSMEVQCQDMAVRLGHRGGRAADWRLLLQLDTDDEAGMMWGDVGSLYFWIREQDARAGDFSRVWTILQCN
jgi:uncharacterized protein YwqG